MPPVVQKNYLMNGEIRNIDYRESTPDRMVVNASVWTETMASAPKNSWTNRLSIAQL